ncbi:hypothetical protein [Thermococcus sp.]|uniref:hypothetical protein n=1 Tax=Thermococcus sp. TaxID=35749 RepID=UPI002624F3EC|nr:hypothetical protein [Thermococcus sp.]
MSKVLAAMMVVVVALLAYAIETAQIPPASLSYHEVFYINNQSSVFVEKDGWGLFEMDIKPKVKGFELTIDFPQGSSYLVEFNGKQYSGTGSFKLTVSSAGTMYIHFRVPNALVNELYHKKGTAEIRVNLEKMPFWRDHYTLHLVPRKSD